MKTIWKETVEIGKTTRRRWEESYREDWGWTKEGMKEDVVVFSLKTTAAYDRKMQVLVIDLQIVSTVNNGHFIHEGIYDTQRICETHQTREGALREVVGIVSIWERRATNLVPSPDTRDSEQVKAEYYALKEKESA